VELEKSDGARVFKHDERRVERGPFVLTGSFLRLARAFSTIGWSMRTEWSRCLDPWAACLS
jgi:hypothetical protein